MTARARLILLGLFLSIGAIINAGCSRQTEPQPIAIDSIEYRVKSDKPILTVAEFLGPRGARSRNILPGRYIVKGKYDLTSTKFDHGVILFDISGSYELQLPNDGVGLSDEEVDAATETPHFEIPKGQLKGQFELTWAVKKVNAGSGKVGIPSVSFCGNQRFRREGGTGTTHETLDLR